MTQKRPSTALPAISTHFRGHKISKAVRRQLNTIKRDIERKASEFTQELEKTRGGTLTAHDLDMLEEYAVNAYASATLFKQYDFLVQEALSRQAKGQEGYGPLMSLAVKIAATAKSYSYQKIIYSRQIQRDINELGEEKTIPTIQAYMMKKTQAQDGEKKTHEKGAQEGTSMNAPPSPKAVLEPARQAEAVQSR